MIQVAAAVSRGSLSTVAEENCKDDHSAPVSNAGFLKAKKSFFLNERMIKSLECGLLLGFLQFELKFLFHLFTDLIGIE